MDSVTPLFDLLRRFAATMAREFDVNDVLYELGDGAMAILDAAGAGVSVVNDAGELVFITSTSQLVVDIEQVQMQEQAGPCVEAFRRGDVVPISDISSLDQWPSTATRRPAAASRRSSACRWCSTTTASARSTCTTPRCASGPSRRSHRPGCSPTWRRRTSSTPASSKRHASSPSGSWWRVCQRGVGVTVVSDDELAGTS